MKPNNKKGLETFLREKKKELANIYYTELTTEDFLDQAIREAFLLGSEVHKIGQHGAVGIETKKGRICSECGLPIVEKLKKKLEKLEEKN